MSSFLNYLIEANLCLLVFGSFYYLVLRKETDFKFRRYYLLVVLMLSLIAPLLQMGNFNLMPTSEISELPSLVLPEFTVGEGDLEVTEGSAYTSVFFEYLQLVYWIIAAIIAQLFLFQIMQLGWLTFSNKTKVKKSGSVYIIYTNGSLPTFSFFNMLFFDNTIDLSRDEKDKVINHEMVHINQAHSIDVVFFEIAKVMMWFNPMIWLLRKEIQDVHEYLADDKIVKHTGEQQYSSLLAKMALKQAHLAIGHHFNKSKTLKRIEMMKANKTQVKSWKSILLAPVVLFTVFIVSCNDEVMQDIDTVMETASQAEMPEELRPELTKLEAKYPDADFKYIETDGTSEEALGNLKDLDPKTIAFIQVFRDKSKIGIIVNQNGPINKLNAQDEIFTIVEEPAKPEGGMQAFYERLATTLKYPKQARQKGIEGRVFVQFVVDETGALNDIKTVKGIGAGCDAAAVAAIQEAAGNWSPPRQRGKAVKQRIILPVTFKLDGDAEKGDSKELEIEES